MARRNERDLVGVVRDDLEEDFARAEFGVVCMSRADKKPGEAESARRMRSGEEWEPEVMSILANSLRLPLDLVEVCFFSLWLAASG